MRTGLMIGTGAVENAWNPIRAALRDLNRSFHDGTENFVFAKLIYELRWYFQIRESMPESARLRLERAHKVQLREYRRLKGMIARNLRAAEQTGTLKIAPALAEVIAAFVPGEACIITTNWDRSIDKFVREKYRSPRPRIFHLHGDSRSAGSLYLPSEVIEERFRTEVQNERLREAAGRTMIALGRCEMLIVYGLSFDPLDAELSSVTGGAFSDTATPKKILVFDLNPVPVAQRMHVLFPDCPCIEARGIEPRSR
jgi:hypothetical protein